MLFVAAAVQPSHNVLCTRLHGGGGFQHVQYYSALKIMTDGSPDEFGHVHSSWKIWIIQNVSAQFSGGRIDILTQCVCCHGQHICLHSFFFIWLFWASASFKIAALPLFTRRSVMILCNRLLLISSLSRCLHVFSPIITISLQQFLLQTFRSRKSGSADQQ